MAPILQKNCQECHRPGQVGPFALETYEQARKRAADIAAVAEDRAMPPWKATPHVGLKFSDVRTLSEPEIATLVAWAEAGAPEGNPADLPPAPKFPDDWELGTPDLVVDIGADFAVPRAATTSIAVSWSRPASTKTSTSRPSSSARATAGSCTTSWRTSTLRQGPRARSSRPGAGLLVLRRPRRADPRRPRRLGAGQPAQPTSPKASADRCRKSDVIIQVHYHPSGKPETDRSRIGLYFARKPVKQTLHWSVVINPSSSFRPGSPTSRSRPPGRSPWTSSPTP